MYPFPYFPTPELKSLHFSYQLSSAMHFSFMKRIFWGVLTNIDHPGILWVTSCANHRCQWKRPYNVRFKIGKVPSLVPLHGQSGHNDVPAWLEEKASYAREHGLWNLEFCIWMSALGMLTMSPWDICLACLKPKLVCQWTTAGEDFSLWKWFSVCMNAQYAFTGWVYNLLLLCE